MEQIFRKDYTGEYVVANRKYENGVTIDEREWIPNTIENKHNGIAVVFGNGSSRSDFDIAPVFSHVGGAFGSRKVVTYGCNAIYRDHKPNFLVVNNRGIAKEVAESGYSKDHVVLTRSDALTIAPNEFHLIPHYDQADCGGTALRLACFDGHKKIYMIGFDGQNLPGENNNVYTGTKGYFAKHELTDDRAWFKYSLQVMNTYPAVEFIRVSYRHNYPMPELWKYASNLKTISYRDFVLEADI